jgi:glycosyl transferase family 25
MFEYIDKVVYINLAHRTDRKEQTEKQLMNLFPPEKIVRFEAIKNDNGAIGCTMSHISVLEMAIKENLKNILILEDDIGWETNVINISVLTDLMNLRYDVVLLSGYYEKYDTKTFKITSAQTTGAYIVNNLYYQTLLTNFKEGLKNLIETNNSSKYAIDRYWKQLQLRHSWYIVIPQICFQIPSYSDIEKKNVNYNKKTYTFGFQ